MTDESSETVIVKWLKDSLAQVEVRGLDHLVVGNDIVSFAEKGLL